jgi:hypothetical protein
MARPAASSYACSVRTSRPASDVLDDLSRLDVEGIVPIERSETYLVLAPGARQRYTTRRAVALTAVSAVAVLILAAWSLVLIVLLPLAVAPLIPFLLEERPLLGVGAVADVESGVRVTAHGHAEERLCRAVDAYLMGLPPVTVPQPEPVGAAGPSA